MQLGRNTPSRPSRLRIQMKRIFCLFVYFTFFSAQAQVVKCKDANGKIVYSDVTCPLNATSSAVNLSGGNVTEAQARAAQEGKASNTNNAAVGEHCLMLMNQAQQTFSSFLERTNSSRWSVSFQSLQTLANSCASSETCQLIKTRIEHSQQRYSQDNTSTRGGQLNSVTSLYAQSCQGGNARQGSASIQTTEDLTKSNRTYWTKDQFGTTVKSDRCFWTKDAFGTAVRSSGCNK